MIDALTIRELQVGLLTAALETQFSRGTAHRAAEGLRQRLRQIESKYQAIVDLSQIIKLTEKEVILIDDLTEMNQALLKLSKELELKTTATLPNCS